MTKEFEEQEPKLCSKCGGRFSAPKYIELPLTLGRLVYTCIKCGYAKTTQTKEHFEANKFKGILTKEI